MSRCLALILPLAFVTPTFASAQEVIGGLTKTSPKPVLRWCFEPARGQLNQCDMKASLTLIIEIAIVRNGLVASCWIDPEDIDLEERTEGICELGKGPDTVDLSGWLVGDALRDLKVIVEQMPVGTYWHLFTENDKAAFQSMLRATRELFEPLPEDLVQIHPQPIPYTDFGVSDTRKFKISRSEGLGDRLGGSSGVWP